MAPSVSARSSQNFACLASDGRKNPTPGFRVDCPTGREDGIKSKTGDAWIAGKRIDDDIGSLWRIHDKLYDLTNFIAKHPGGRFWLETTRGTDITEAFESAHVNPAVAKMLPKFYIGTGPNLKIRLLMDSYVAIFLALLVTASLYHSYLAACGADNFRMYYFDLSLMASAEWRITHGLSHHLFTNTLYDFEISVLEPAMRFLPDPHKHIMNKYVSPVACHLVLLFAFFVNGFKRIAAIIMGTHKLVWANALPLVECALMMLVSGSVQTGFSLWMAMVFSSSFCFSWIGVVAAHHHPEIYHAYDTFRSDPDWGLCQLDAVRDNFLPAKQLVCGMYTQLCSNKPNPEPPRFPRDQPLLPEVIRNMMEEDKDTKYQKEK
ncbi:hypothetical protein HAZT_HAZT010028 [Hyalella azteca]|uniref:Cytochrome b5 heme-binding domain-containing protein n=1 Tax=Hyalella azteca TaxID=294128 RepID=A0A6A0H1E5_HYAAZ|nr:hypothetical protein HAZT_HAZT010028 [Hyalella azteca]